jgi:hypothetical protein
MNSITSDIDQALNLFNGDVKKMLQLKYKNVLRQNGDLVEFLNSLFERFDDENNSDDDYEEKEEKFDTLEYLNLQSNNFFNNNEEILMNSDRRELVKLIVGNVQSGKTSVICGLSVYNLLFRQKTTIIIVRNLVGDYKQLAAKFGDKGPFSGRNLHLEKNIDVLFTGNKKDKINIFKIGNALNCSVPGIIIAIANGTEMKTLVDLVQTIGIDNVDFDIIIDECDDLGYKKIMTSSYLRNYTILKDYSSQIFGVTATAFDVMFIENELNSGKVFRLERPQNYKGVSNIEFRHMNTSTTFDQVGLEFQMNREMVELYLRIQGTRFEDAIEFEGELQCHPNIILHRVSHLTTSHDNMMKAFVTMDILKDWTCIVYNGTGISVFGRLLAYDPDEPFIIDGVTGTMDEDEVWHWDGIGIQHALQMLRNRDPDAELFSNICIAAGRLASRGINFCSLDYKWHLTHQILATTSSSSISELIQSIRLCGVYTDDIPLVLYTPQKDINDLRNSCELHEQLVDGVINYQDNVSVKDLYSRIPVFSDLIPKRRISKKANYIFNQMPRPRQTDTNAVRLILRGNILSDGYVRSYENTCRAMELIGRNRWINRADVIKKIKEEVDQEKWTQHYNAQLKDFGLVDRFHTIQDILETTNGLLMRKNGRNWQLRLN